MSESVGAALRRGACLLDAAGIEGAAREARLLLGHALGEPASALLDPSRVVPTATYDAVLRRRAAREPMAFILGRQGFWTLDLEVSPATLIPRADTETVIEALVAAFPPPRAPANILDLGTGTGALLLAALAEYPGAWGVGIDAAPEAARLAARNAATHGLSGRALFLAGNWDSPLSGQWDAILCNPPYIRRDALAGLMPEVGKFEPRAALDGGADGLDAYRKIFPRLGALLASTGVAVFEIGAGQEAAVAGLASASGLTAPVIRRDLGGHVRAMTLRAGNR